MYAELRWRTSRTHAPSRFPQPCITLLICRRRHIEGTGAKADADCQCRHLKQLLRHLQFSPTSGRGRHALPVRIKFSAHPFEIINDVALTKTGFGLALSSPSGLQPLRVCVRTLVKVLIAI